MKFKLLRHNDSVFADHGVNIELKNWKDWEDFILSVRLKGVQTDLEKRWDLDECRECGVISLEHLTEYLKFVTRK